MSTLFVFKESGSERVVRRNLVVPGTRSEGLKDRNCFHNTQNVICLLHGIDICSDGAKAMVGKTSSILIIKAVAPN